MDRARGCAGRGAERPAGHLDAQVDREILRRAVGRAPGLRSFPPGLPRAHGGSGGKTHAVAWRVDPAVLTQSGGEEWMRDAVRLLAVGCHRRRDLEDPSERRATTTTTTATRREIDRSRGRSLWTSPTWTCTNSSARFPPTSDSATPDSHPASWWRTRPDPGTRPGKCRTPGFGGSDCVASLGKRRHVCCMLFVVATLCALAVAVR